MEEFTWADVSDIRLTKRLIKLGDRLRQAPPLREVIRRIAMLGGLLASKGDGEPGVKTLWQGYSKLFSFVRRVEQMRSLHALCIAWNGMDQTIE